MANVNTTETAILNQILTELRAMTGMHEANAFIAAYPIFLPAPPGDQYLELIPGVATDKAAKHPIGWMLDTFTVCIFKRLYNDQDGRDTARIADASLGLLVLVASVEQTLAESFLAGLALVPVLPERREAGERNPEDAFDGWVMMKRQFRTEYLYALPGPHSTS